jgi:hypothetical protein
MAQPPQPGRKAEVPTMDEFAALEARVTAAEANIASLDGRVDSLETGGGTTPPIDPPINPNPEPPVVTDGIQAKRVAGLIESFGVNTFSSLDSGNSWGSWPADYSPDSTIAALQYLVGTSGFTLPIREYHYAGRFDMQKQWFARILATFPDTKITLCPGANASAGDVPTMAQLPHTWLEGENEPNTDFGSGQVPFSVTMDVQNAVWGKRRNNNVMGPSIVAGTPHPEGWVTGYCGTPENLAALNAKLDYSNCHYYPPGSPDVPNTGYSINEYIGGIWSVYGEHATFMTEFHPTLYNSRGHKPDESGWSGARDAYYTLCTLLRCGKNGTQGIWWYALFDYGTTYRCGLFPKHGRDDPRPVADAFRNLCEICMDPGDRHSFAPDKLDLTVTGMTDAMDYDVYQASDGRFLVAAWHAAEELGQGATVSVELVFGSSKSAINVFNPIDSPGPVDRITNADRVTLDLPPGVVVIEVKP